MDDTIYNELKRLVDIALKENEVPVAAVIVNNGNIIGRGYNKVEQTQNFMNHAEIIAINEAIKNKGNWRLDDCEIYVSLEPCSMCKEFIKKSRIKKVYYYSNQNYELTESTPDYIYCDDKYFSTELINFFKKIRKDK